MLKVTTQSVRYEKNVLEHDEEIALKFKALEHPAQLESAQKAGFVLSPDTGACVAYMLNSALNPEAFDKLKESFSLFEV